jgi:2-keto-3-deoxy-L-fuconate dehydrogenase
MFELKGKISVVSGAGSGIGAAIAEVFARAGSAVVVVDRDSTGGETVVARLRELGAESWFVSVDVAESDACFGLAARVMERYGRLDVLVNNAGIGHVGTIHDTTVEDLDRLYRVNVRGVFNLSKAFLPGMIGRRSGSVVNMASIGGLVAVPDRLAYCATKFAVVGLTKSMAYDHAREGVRVNCICPGRVETPFVSARLAEYPDPKKAYEAMCASQPMGRMGRPEEIAAAALYLASDEASFVTGATFTIDGGWSAG